MFVKNTPFIKRLTNSSVGIPMGIKPASEGGNRSPRKVRIPTPLLAKKFQESDDGIDRFQRAL